MPQKYCITKESNFKPIKESLWYYFQSTLLLAISFFIPLEIAIWVLIIAIGLPLGLQTSLHLNYYLYDKSKSIELDHGKRLLKISDNFKSVTVSFNEIKKVTRIQGSKYPNKFEPYSIPSNFYHYTIVETLNGEIFKFTDLIFPNFSISTIRKETKVIPIFNWIK